MHMTDEAAAGDQLRSFDSNAMPWGELNIDQLKLGVPLKAFISDIRYAFEDEQDSSTG
jgi:hypothetical protein